MSKSITIEDAINAGNGTLHGAIDYWMRRALEAEQQRDELESEVRKTIRRLLTTEQQRDELQSKCDELLETLVGYGEHRPSCSIVMWPVTEECDCGFSEELAKAMEQQ